MRLVLQRRFDMSSWFKRHGFPVDEVTAQSLAAAEAERGHAAALGLACGQQPTQAQIEMLLAGKAMTTEPMAQQPPEAQPSEEA